MRLPPFLEKCREFGETYTTDSHTEATLVKSKNGFSEALVFEIRLPPFPEKNVETAQKVSPRPPQGLLESPFQDAPNVVLKMSHSCSKDVRSCPEAVRIVPKAGGPAALDSYKKQALDCYRERALD